MAAGPWIVYDSFLKEKNLGTHVMGGTPDIFKVALAAQAYVPDILLAGDALYSDITNEVSQTDTGYTTGGQAEVVSIDDTVAGEMTIDIVSPDWTAGTANLVAATAIIYNTSKSNKLVAYCILDDDTTPGTPTDITVTSTNTLTVNTAAGIYTESRIDA